MSSISADHQRDIIDAFDSVPTSHRTIWDQHQQQQQQVVAHASPDFSHPDPMAGLLVIPHTLLIIIREQGEHVNLFHTMTDFWNTWLMFIVTNTNNMQSTPKHDGIAANITAGHKRAHPSHPTYVYKQGHLRLCFSVLL